MQAVQTPTETIPPATAGDTRDIRATNLPPPEVVEVMHREVYCDGSGYGDGGEHHALANIPAALGHPRVFLPIPARQAFVDCTYCDRRFLMAG
jgi:uncharacterized Zn-finger protein